MIPVEITYNVYDTFCAKYKIKIINIFHFVFERYVCQFLCEDQPTNL